MTTIDEVLNVVMQIRPLLAGKAPELQGAVIADLLSFFVAGHHPSVRDEQLDLIISTVRDLIPINEAAYFQEPAVCEGRHK